ncbi:TIR domain-containing protein [Microbacterium paludicola]|uniref:TIR domain-containing protein n=1 Tax=Microbacterium paludicola TaxID=300019 RepID=A0A4Y9FMM4_9MICO|nr:toll/interleukin-1 receptor domain-containing protein [Microbacterium paludicola]TFU30464.1 TIR domain-containing protein [Microbacterium paludicola]
MSQCTAPIEGHRTASGAASCPVCRYRSSRRGSHYSPHSTYTPPSSAHSTPTPPRRFPSYASKSSAGGSGRRASSLAKRSAVSYSISEYQTLNPVHEQVVRIAQTDNDRRDLFLCHAWDDRQSAALDFYNLLSGLDVKVWFSEKDVPLGTSLLRQIDRGLRNSRAGVVLITPAMLKSLNAEGIADKELSALLATDRVIPVAHGTTFEALRDVSPLLAARSGLTTSEYASLDEVATKIADAVLLD